MRVAKIYANTFGLKFTDRAKNFFENKYRHYPEKLIEVEMLESKYPNDIVLDIKKNAKNNPKSFTCTLKNKSSKDFMECQFFDFQGIYEIENFIKSYIKI